MNPTLPKELYEIIISYIPNPKTFLNVSQVSKSFNSICKKLTLQKMDQFEKGGYLPNGNLHGKYECWWISGKMKEEIHYVNGKKHGSYKSWHFDGNVHIETQYINDEIHGEYKSWYAVGRKQHHYFCLNGQLHGEYKAWFYNGHLWEHSHFVNGKFHGERIIYYTDGNANVIVYTHGSKYKIVHILKELWSYFIHVFKRN